MFDLSTVPSTVTPRLDDPMAGLRVPAGRLGAIYTPSVSCRMVPKGGIILSDQNRLPLGQSAQVSDALEVGRHGDADRRSLFPVVPPIRPYFGTRCQDACSIDPKKGLYALADGVGSAPLSGEWASILTSQFTANPPSSLLFEAIREWGTRCREKHERECFPASEDLIAHFQTFAGKPVQKRLATSHGSATFVGLSLGPKEESDSLSTVARLTGIAVGDSCFFHFRHDKLITALPINHSTDFSSHTCSIATRPSGLDFSLPVMLEGRCELGDKIILASDAFSEWLLGRLEQNNNILRDEDGFSNAEMEDEARFNERIISLRSSEQINNDDVTVIYLRF